MARLPKGLVGIWHRITGKYQEVRAQNEAEAREARDRQAQERQALIDKQLERRAVLQAEFKELRKRQAERLLELRQDIGRFLKFTKPHDAGLSRDRSPSLGLRLDR